MFGSLFVFVSCVVLCFAEGQIQQQCQPNEEVRCMNVCPPERTCKTRDIKYKCLVTDEPCQSKCVCKEGYFRNFLGTCITEAECGQIQQQCQPNEEVRCMNVCPPEKTCKNRGIFFRCVTPQEPCENKCVCKEGYFRNFLGTCITEAECGQIQLQCPPNEEVQCMYACPPEKTCKTRGIEFDCSPPEEPCKNQCVCKEGYFRNFLGTCITEAECEQCSGENQFFACDSACDNTCSTLSEQNRTNCPIQNIICNRKCYCEDGFARDDNGNCIPTYKCPPVPECPENEEYTCKQSCPPEVCLQISASFNCLNSPPCQPACACKPGFYRLTLDSPCIPTCECPQMQNAPECKENRIPHS